MQTANELVSSANDLRKIYLLPNGKYRPYLIKFSETNSSILKIKLNEILFYPPNRKSKFSIDYKCLQADKLAKEKFEKTIGYD